MKSLSTSSDESLNSLASLSQMSEREYGNLMKLLIAELEEVGKKKRQVRRKLARVMASEAGDVRAAAIYGLAFRVLGNDDMLIIIDSVRMVRVESYAVGPDGFVNPGTITDGYHRECEADLIRSALWS